MCPLMARVEHLTGYTMTRCFAVACSSSIASQNDFSLCSLAISPKYRNYHTPLRMMQLRATTRRSQSGAGSPGRPARIPAPQRR